MKSFYPSHHRRGGVYIAVLGTAMIVSVLGLSALLLQRVQNRQLSNTSDVRQAQLNAEAAVDLALLTIDADATWRTDQTNGDWFTSRSIGSGTCAANVVDPIDGNLANDVLQPIVLTGTGASGRATQRYKLTLDPRKQPLECLRSAVAVGDVIDLNGDILRTADLITANEVDANSSIVYGNVEAVTIDGSTYAGTTTQISASERPEMPDWDTVFDYYRTSGTPISISDLPTVTPNLGRNTGIETGTNDWSGDPPYSILGDTQISQSNNFKRGGTYSLRCQNRDYFFSGPIQLIDSFVKSGGQYNVEIWVYQTSGSARNFHLTLYTKGSGSVQFDSGSATSVNSGAWTRVSATLTAPSWSGDLEYAFIKIGGSDLNNTGEFYADDLVIRENVSGRFIYRQVLSPSINPFGPGTTNSQGVYWIDCGGQRLIIERSRILGTLLVINPGSDSRVSDGPIYWSPAVTGYPALLVDADVAVEADFSIRATNRGLNEKDNGVNYNPTGASHSEFGADNDTSDIYRSEIVGLIAIRDDLSFQNTSLVRGQIIVGDDINTSSGSLEVEYQPESLFNPPPGFVGPYRHERRPASATKAVLP
jgi:hypothetical protein